MNLIFLSAKVVDSKGADYFVIRDLKVEHKRSAQEIGVGIHRYHRTATP